MKFIDWVRSLFAHKCLFHTIHSEFIGDGEYIYKRVLYNFCLRCGKDKK